MSRLNEYMESVEVATIENDLRRAGVSLAMREYVDSALRSAYRAGVRDAYDGAYARTSRRIGNNASASIAVNIAAAACFIAGTAWFIADLISLYV